MYRSHDTICSHTGVGRTHNGGLIAGAFIYFFVCQEFMDWHRPRVASLLGCGVDLLAIETQPALVRKGCW